MPWIEQIPVEQASGRLKREFDAAKEQDRYGMDDAQVDAFVHQIARDWRQAPLAAADRALCEHAVKLTLRQQEICPADLDVLRSHGFSDRDIHDATQVIAFFNYITRVAEGLGVEPEDFIQPPWGSVP